MNIIINVVFFKSVHLTYLFFLEEEDYIKVSNLKNPFLEEKFKKEKEKYFLL